MATAEHQIHRRPQEPGQQPGALRHQGGLSQKIDLHRLFATHRGTVCRDGQPFTGLDALLELHHQGQIKLHDLNDTDLAGACLP